MLLTRNISMGGIGSSAEVFNHKDDKRIVKIDIRPAQPFTVRPGMIVYIWMPGVSLASLFQSHPFTIVWWEKKNDNRKAESISLLVQVQSRFTRELLNLSHKAFTFITWVDGPYGIPVNLNPYKRVLMIATGIGIAAQISYIKELLDNHNESSLANRTIIVVWEVEEECKHAITILYLFGI
jgi:NAD(P)H-flavin reductase